MINARNLVKELNKSEVGKETLEYIFENNLKIDLFYSEQQSIKGLRGRVIGSNIEIFVNHTKTKKETVKTIIHEITHVKYGQNPYRRKEEVLCFLRELLHDKNELTTDDIRSTLKLVKELYPELKWR